MKTKSTMAIFQAKGDSRPWFYGFYSAFTLQQGEQERWQSDQQLSIFCFSVCRKLIPAQYFSIYRAVVDRQVSSAWSSTVCDVPAC